MVINCKSTKNIDFFCILKSTYCPGFQKEYQLIQWSKKNHPNYDTAMCEVAIHQDRCASLKNLPYPNVLRKWFYHYKIRWERFWCPWLKVMTQLIHKCIIHNLHNMKQNILINWSLLLLPSVVTSPLSDGIVSWSAQSPRLLFCLQAW